MSNYLDLVKWSECSFLAHETCAMSTFLSIGQGRKGFGKFQRRDLGLGASFEAGSARKASTEVGRWDLPRLWPSSGGWRSASPLSLTSTSQI